MKFLSTAAALLALAYAQDDESTRDMSMSPEKERFFYGRPGDADYEEPRGADDIIRLEKMWKIDLDLQKTRGAIQGFHRGMYLQIDYDLPEKCLPKDTNLKLYWLMTYIRDFAFGEVFNVMGLLYTLYYNVDFECEIENYLYDLSMFCFDHDCSTDKLMKNWMNKVFQVTAAINALGAVYYDEAPSEESHVLWFDFYSQVGQNIGKLGRYMLDFDPKEINY